MINNLNDLMLLAWQFDVTCDVFFIAPAVVFHSLEQSKSFLLYIQKKKMQLFSKYDKKAWSILIAHSRLEYSPLVISTFKCIVFNFVLSLCRVLSLVIYLLCLSQYHYFNASLHLPLFWERECVIKNFLLFLSITTTSYTKRSLHLSCSLIQLIITTFIFILRRSKFKVAKKLCTIKFEHLKIAHRLHFISSSKFETWKETTFISKNL